MTEDRYRYRLLKTEKFILLLRDDGYRIEFLVLAPEPIDPLQLEWVLWAEYKQCDMPGPSGEIADWLMEEREAHDRARNQF